MLKLIFVLGRMERVFVDRKSQQRIRGERGKGTSKLQFMSTFIPMILAGCSQIELGKR